MVKYYGLLGFTQNKMISLLVNEHKKRKKYHKLYKKRTKQLKNLQKTINDFQLQLMIVKNNKI